MANPAGYLYRVGQTRAAEARRPLRVVPAERPGGEPPWMEPELEPALLGLTEQQRVAVVLCHGFQWTHREVAELLDLAPSSVQNHVERGLATGRSRRLVAVAAVIVLVGAVVAGGWAIIDDGGDDPTGVDTVDQPETSTTLELTTTTGVREFSDMVGPDLVVVHSPEHSLQVLDRTSGETVRVLAEFDDPAAGVPEGEPEGQGSYLGTFVVSPDGQSVYFEACCEPTAEGIFRIPITGGEPEFVTTGFSPAVSPDGTKLAVIESQALLVIDLGDGGEQRYPLAADESVVLLASPSWSPDGTQLVLERYDDSLDDGRVMLVSLADGNEALSVGRTIAETDADGTPMHPVFGQGEAIVVVRQPSALDTSQGARAETYRTSGRNEPIATDELDMPVVSQRTTGAGQLLLRTFADGTLTGPMFTISDGGYLDAAW